MLITCPGVVQFTDTLPSACYYLRLLTSTSCFPLCGKNEMARFIQQQVTIHTPGTLEIHSPELKPGMRVEVRLLLKDVPQTRNSYPLLSFMGTGRGTFSSSEEADVFLRQERDLWE